MRISFAYDPAPHRCRRGVPVRDSVKALKADISTLVQITVDQANEIEMLRGALRPLALVAKRIDDHPGGKLRPDSATLWVANVWTEGPSDLTMGHARAARRLLEPFTQATDRPHEGEI